MARDIPGDLEDAGSLGSEDLAALIVDALVIAGIVGKGDAARAIEIATEEIEVRKASATADGLRILRPDGD